MFDRKLSFAGLIMLGAAVPALAAAQTAKPAAKPAAAAQQPPTRAGLISGMQTNFKAIDTNGDGTLNTAELQAAEGKVQQQRVAQLRARVEAEFTKLDTNKDGQLSKTEFMAAAPTASSTPPNGAKLLGELDKNKDGKVSVEEYRAPILSKFDAIDTNHDGTISQTERQAAQTKR